ncbi:MAG: PIN domain-containing protein [Rhodopirellula sp. JB044]|uniref:PIN domain-containing protein n=1 Tax=Rhodopirellula sp. JB044 TaxID=3342844 RepID=UPI00370CD512
MRRSTNNPVAPGTTRVLLIDLDNCPHEVLNLTTTAERYDLIIASHGLQEPRVPLGMASVLGLLIAQGKIEIWAMPAGKNSADFGLTFIAGRLSAELPKDAVFEVASKDKDLDHAVDLLTRTGFAAMRVDSSSNSDVKPPTTAEVSVLASRIASSFNGRGAKSRPKRKRSLHAVVKARGPTPDHGMSALKELERAGAIAYNRHGIPTYDDETLKSLASLAPKKKNKTEALELKKLIPPKRAARKTNESQLTLFEYDEPETAAEIETLPLDLSNACANVLDRHPIEEPIQDTINNDDVPF